MKGEFALASSASSGRLVLLVAAARCALKFVPVGVAGAAATLNAVLTAV